MNKARRNAIQGRLRAVFATAPAMLPFAQVVARCAGLGQASHVLEVLQRMENDKEAERDGDSWGRPGAMKGAT